MRLAERHARASALIASARDVIDERPVGGALPAWAVRRGWRGFLEALTDAEVAAAEQDGLGPALAGRSDAPGDLLAIGAEARAVIELPAAVRGEGAVAARRASPRKREQVAAFAALAAGVARGCARVVDVGSGHGHLTRHLAEVLAVDAEGWERDPARVAVASELGRGGRARFVAADAGALAATLRAGDLVVGLHACGALGDLAVRAAGEAGAAVALVGCCLQKRDGPRAPLAAAAGVGREALTLGRAVLGLGNARDGDAGVEDDLATRTRSRVQRRALAALLRDAGAGLAAGEEMRGVNRRRATGDFCELVARGFAGRGVSAPGAGEAAAALTAAWRAYAVEQRMALARAMLARVVEVWVALDRAAWLAERGYVAEVVRAFDASVSPRNVAVVARVAG